MLVWGTADDGIAKASHISCFSKAADIQTWGSFLAPEIRPARFN